MLNRQRKAMTLGEVLIVIGIIGVVAAITTPLLKLVVPDNQEALEQKAGYILEHTLSDIVNNDEYYPVKKDIDSDGNAINVYGLQNTDDVLVNGTTYGGKTKFCKLMANSLKLKEGSPMHCEEADEGTEEWSFETADGMKWHVPVTDFSDAANPNAQIFVYVKNSRLDKNCGTFESCFNTSGTNVYQFTVTPTGNVISKTNVSPETAGALGAPKKKHS